MTEYQHQRTVMEWSCYASNRIRYPGLDLLYHIPNEIKCNAAQGKQRKDIGVKSGVPDLCFDKDGNETTEKPEEMAETIDGAGLSCKGLLWVRRSNPVH